MLVAIFRSVQVLAAVAGLAYISVTSSVSEILPSFQAGDKPRFEFYGKNRILEYLDTGTLQGLSLN
jgi:hypothetical protein